MADKIDSRVRQTRAALLGALPLLMIERGYERITIQNVLERADVGRATFYAHFSSKDDLLAGSVANLRAWLVEAWRNMPEQRLGFTLPFFEHLATHGAIYEKSLKILALREQAKAALGPRFDLKQFHNEVLTHGALPLTVLEGVINDWIARRKAD